MARSPGRSNPLRVRRLVSVAAVLATACIALGFHSTAPNAVVERAYHENGALKWERSYVEGREDGLHRGWYADGRVHFEYEYKDGRLEGEAREWFPNGMRYRVFNYSEGRESGTQRMWHEDGTLRANYVVKNGRRYGLIGAKGCVGDSIDETRILQEGVGQ
jgi:antitoxin component YwqK of YwqJK toxin-antitoxin module